MKPWKGEQVQWASFKLDGHYTKIVKDCNGSIRIFTSHPTDITDKVGDLIINEGMIVNMPSPTTLEGELWVPGEPASFVKSAIKHHDPRLRFDCFNVKVPVSGEEQDLLFVLAAKYCQWWGVPFVPFEIFCTNQDYTSLLPYAGGFPIEGWVFIGPCNERYKLKPVKTIDLVVTGTKDGSGKYIGLMGALLGSVYFPASDSYVEVASVSGMDDATRIEFSDDPPIGKVIEVAYQYVGSGARLRHPRFVRLRDDKCRDGCQCDQDPMLEHQLIGGPNEDL